MKDVTNTEGIPRKPPSGLHFNGNFHFQTPRLGKSAIQTKYVRGGALFGLVSRLNYISQDGRENSIHQNFRGSFSSLKFNFLLSYSLYSCLTTGCFYNRHAMAKSRVTTGSIRCYTHILMIHLQKKQKNSHNSTFPLDFSTGISRRKAGSVGSSVGSGIGISVTWARGK